MANTQAGEYRQDFQEEREVWEEETKSHQADMEETEWAEWR